MTEAVSDVSYQIHIFTLFSSEQTIHSVDNYLDNVDVFPLVEAANIVSFGNLSVMEDGIDSASVVYHRFTLTHVIALSI